MSREDYARIGLGLSYGVLLLGFVIGIIPQSQFIIGLGAYFATLYVFQKTVEEQ